MVQFPRSLVNAILAQAHARPGEEVCGLVARDPHAGLRLYPVANVAAAPATRFEMDPGGQIAAMRRMRERGEALLAIYHTHPEGPAEPSPIDIRRAEYPEALQLIVSLVDPDAPRWGLWRIRDGQAEPVAMQIVEA